MNTHGTERRLVNQESFHKWVATFATMFALTWGLMGYYIQAEGGKQEARLQSQITVLQLHQAASTRVNELVLIIDKKLSNIESKLVRQTDLIEEVRDLRKDVNFLKVELAKRGKDND